MRKDFSHSFLKGENVTSKTRAANWGASEGS